MLKSIKYCILLQAIIMIISFTTMCLKVEGFLIQNGGISIDCARRVQIGSTPCVRPSFNANEFRIPSLQSRFAIEGCQGIGQYCSTSEQCCTRKCLSTRRRCVS